jgi:hypothetical protein
MKQTVTAIAICCAVFAALAYGQAAKPSQQGHFVILSAADGSVVWRLNTATGAVSYCLTALKNTNPLASGEGFNRNMSCTPWMN